MVTTVTIDGMRSVHCARAVHTSLARIPGIAAADVVIGRATLEHDAALDPPALAAAIEAVGYSVRSIATDRRRLPLHTPGDGEGRAGTA
ncbi:MAG TPA: heavy metal-associated domain-containing protein [Gemmatimonadaceae bacterium]|nr:heavy metal-associated domain-containing protein [Gemmatimonadaceae bacterium]